MSKKVTFLLVVLFVLLISSVTVFATGTESETPKAGFTEDKASPAEAVPEVSVSDLEAKYEELFFKEDSKSSKELVTIGYEREYPHELRHLFTAMPLDSGIDKSNPYIMLMYIKVDGVYVSLVDVESKTNITQLPYYLRASVELKYLGSNKTNEVRIIVFKKNDMDTLTPDENLQITDLKMTVRRWNPVERIYFGIKEILN